jgi:hypothetical protein
LYVLDLPWQRQRLDDANTCVECEVCSSHATAQKLLILSVLHETAVVLIPTSETPEGCEQYNAYLSDYACHRFRYEIRSPGEFSRSGFRSDWSKCRCMPTTRRAFVSGFGTIGRLPRNERDNHNMKSEKLRVIGHVIRGRYHIIPTT